MKANVEYAVRHQELNGEFIGWLKQFVKAVVIADKPFFYRSIQGASNDAPFHLRNKNQSIKINSQQIIMLWNLFHACSI